MLNDILLIAPEFRITENVTKYPVRGVIGGVVRSGMLVRIVRHPLGGFLPYSGAMFEGEWQGCKMDNCLTYYPLCAAQRAIYIREVQDRYRGCNKITG